MPWSEERKAAIEMAVGSTSYTSSDESDFSEDENSERVLSGYLVKKLPWERKTLTKAKKDLDDAYKKSLKPRARVNLVTRRVHPRPSTRCPPTDVLEWAVRVQEPTPSSDTKPAAAFLQCPDCDNFYAYPISKDSKSFPSHPSSTILSNSPQHVSSDNGKPVL